jgi:hypothetical protein
MLVRLVLATAVGWEPGVNTLGGITAITTADERRNQRASMKGLWAPPAADWRPGRSRVRKS